MDLKKILLIMAVLVGALVWVPWSAWATSYVWDAGGSKDNWTTPGNWDLSGHPNALDAQATIDTAIGTPVLLTGTRQLGGGANCLTIGASAGPNALNIDKGGTLRVRGNISNAQTITINSRGTLQAYPVKRGSGMYNLTGGGNISLLGGTISTRRGTTGTWNFQEAVSGYGVISAPVISNSTLTADSGGGSGKVLKINQAVSGAGDVIVGLNAADTVMLDLGANLEGKNFTLNQAASLRVGASNTISLTGNFTNNSQTESNWLSGQGFNLTMSGGTFEVAGYDNGPTSGFSNNFNLNTLTVTGDLQLVDLVDNGNRTGIHGAQEALYVNFLSGSGTLDLNGLRCYINNGGALLALGDGLYHGVTVSGAAAAPIPGSLWLAGSGLMVLGLLRFWRREGKI